MLLLYGVGEDRLRGELPEQGIDARPLRMLSRGGLAAVVSESPVALAPTKEALLDYEQVVERLLALTPLLPARFGTLLDGDSAVTKLLNERGCEFATSLDRVRGAAELGLHGEWLDGHGHPSSDGPGAGAAYMRSRLAERRRSAELARQLELTFADLARASVAKPLTDPRTAFSGSYLVAVGDVDEFLGRLQGLERSSEDVTFVCTGPWPPYSFANPEAR